MSNPYLARLRAINFEKGLPSQPSKPSKPGYDGFEGKQGMGFLKNQTFAVDTGLTQNSEKHIPRQPSKPSKLDSFPFESVLSELEARCPDYVEPNRWQQCIEDAQRFLADCGAQAEALGWTADELLGLHEPPKEPKPNYHRLSRYDCTGLIWGLNGRRVVALSSDTATVETSSGALIYRKHHKPAFGPLGDSLDEFIA
jgi:hypothetical protein